MAANPAELLTIGSFIVARGLEDRDPAMGLLLDDSTTSENVGGLLLLRAGPSPANLAVSNWYVDAVNGSDAFDGQSPATAFKTFSKLASTLFVQEYHRLPGRLSVVIAPIQLIVINILSDLPASDPIRLRGDLPPNSLLAFVGSTTTVANGVVTAAGAQVRAANTPWSITADDTDTLAPMVWGDKIGRRIRVTGGAPANIGQVAWAAKDLGAGAARISTPNNPGLPPPDDRLFQTAPTPGILSVGDTFVVEDSVKVYMDYVEISSSFQGQATVPTVGFANFDFQRSGTFFISSCTIPGGDLESVFKGCRFRGTVLPRWSPQRNHMVNCCFDLGVNLVRQSAGIFFQGGLSLGEVGIRGGSCFTNLDFMIQGSRLNVLFGSAQVQLLSVFDSPTSGVVVGADFGGDASATMIVGSSVIPGGTLWGADNAQAGVDVLGGRRMLFVPTASISITGTGVGNVQIAGNTANLLSQDLAGVYAPVAVNWPAILAAGNAQIPSRGAGIFKTTV